MMSDWVIQTDHLTRFFGARCAVDQVKLNVPRGSVFALLGRNGSGKTTLIRMLLGMLEPTRGSATLLGEDCRLLSPATRRRVGYVAENHPLIDWMRVDQIEDYQRSFYPSWNGKLFATILDHFELHPQAQAGQISRGQRAGLSLALVLAPEPELLIMDDPSMGLDPVARRTLLEAMILVTRGAGRTILLSSHVLDDVERVADHVAIIDRSVLRVSAPVELFRSRVKRWQLRFAGEAPPSPVIAGLLESRRDGRDLRLTIANPSGDIEQAIAALNPESMEETPLSLEDAVVAYLGRRGELVSLLQSTRERQGVA